MDGKCGKSQVARYGTLTGGRGGHLWVAKNRGLTGEEGLTGISVKGFTEPMKEEVLPGKMIRVVPVQMCVSLYPL